MREVLFRGKRINNGEWVKGMLNVLTKKVAQIGGYTDYGTHVCIGNSYGVDPSTVGQYTGLKDKNGTKIFEGDIVRFGFSRENWGDMAEIIFECGEFRYKPITNAEKVWNCRMCGEEKTMCVVGNIHDNPELLELV